MTSSKKTLRTPAGRYRTYSTPEGLLYGEFSKREGGGSDLLLMDGTIVALPESARTQSAAEPDIVPPLPFVDVMPEEASVAFKVLLDHFRTEYSNPDDRRRWAESRVGSSLPVGRDVDELIRYRYEEYRRGRDAALAALLESQSQTGRHTLLLECLESDKPGDVRRVAVLVAASTTVHEATPLICAASMHKTQLDLARSAMHSLARFAPERLPLVVAYAQESVAAPEVLAVVHSLPEWVLLNSACLSRTDSGSPDDLVPGRIAHLISALATSDAVLAWQRLATVHEELCRSVAAATAGILQPLVAEESPTAYATALRNGLARSVLAASPEQLDRQLRSTAARIVTRDMAPEEAARVLLQLHEPSAQLLLATSLSHPRSRATREMLRTAAKERSHLGALVSNLLMDLVRQNEFEGSAKVFALALLARTSIGRDIARRGATTELGSSGEEQDAVLARALIEGEAIPDLSRLRGAGRLALLGALVFGSSRIAASVLNELRPLSSAESIGLESEATRLPIEWIDSDEELRGVLTSWVAPLLEADATSSALFSSAMRALTKDAPSRWSSWDEGVRHACLAAISRADKGDSVTFFAQMIASREEGSAEQYMLLHEFFSRVVSRHPDVVASIAPALPTEIALKQALQTASTLHHDVCDHESRRQLAISGQLRTLGQALAECASTASAALGTEESLGALLGRLASEVREALRASDPASNTQVAAFLQLQATTEPTTLTREALRGAGSRAAGSPLALAFFREQALQLLASLGLEGIRNLLHSDQRFVERLGPAASEVLAEALILAGAEASEALTLVAGPRAIQSAVGIGIRVVDRQSTAALDLIRLKGGGLTDLANALGELRRALDASSGIGGESADPISVLVRRIAPTLDALEQMILPVMRIRRILSQNGLQPVEPVLGAIRDFDELSAGQHKVMGMSADRGTHEVLTFGVRVEGSRDAIVPALVARVLED